MLNNTTVKFLLFIVLVWLSVVLGRVLVGAIPALPTPIKNLAAPDVDDRSQSDLALG